MPSIPFGARVLDIGCADGALFHRLGARISSGIGIDPDCTEGPAGERAMLHRGHFPAAIPEHTTFDIICFLAVLEHVAEATISIMAKQCFDRLVPGGRVIATVPSPRADSILNLLRHLRLIDGMSLEQHHGLDPRVLPGLFSAAGFRVVTMRRFQLGLNNLFVFERPGAA